MAEHVGGGEQQRRMNRSTEDREVSHEIRESSHRKKAHRQAKILTNMLPNAYIVNDKKLRLERPTPIRHSSRRFTPPKSKRRMMMQPKLYIVPAKGASPTSEPNLLQLVEQAANKTCAVKRIADGVENVEEVEITDFIDISELCADALQLLAHIKSLLEGNTPQPPAAAVTVPQPTPATNLSAAA